MNRSRRSRPSANNQVLPASEEAPDDEATEPVGRVTPIFRLDAVGMSVLPMLFSVPGEKDQKGQIRFEDFLRFIAQMELILRKQSSAGWVFTPSPDGRLAGLGPVKFHKPHRPGAGNKLEFFYARLYGRALARAYNVTAGNFEAAKS